MLADVVSRCGIFERLFVTVHLQLPIDQHRHAMMVLYTFDVSAASPIQAISPPPTPVTSAQPAPLGAATPPPDSPPASSPPSAPLAYRATSSVSLSYREGAVVPGQSHAFPQTVDLRPYSQERGVIIP